MENLLYILLAIFFLLLNAFFVLSEFAIVKVRNTKLDELENKGIKTAKAVKDAVKHLDEYLSTCQLGVTIASLGLGWVGEPAFANLIKPIMTKIGIPFSNTLSHTLSISIAFILITSMHVVIGELTPKNLAIRIPEKFALLVIYPLRIFHNIIFIPMWLLKESSNLILKLLNIKSEEMTHSEDEIKIILGQTEEIGKISLGRLMMFEHLFDFGKTTVKEIMTPKENIAYLKNSDDIEKIISIIKEKKFSRYPLLDEKNNYIGFIHIKDIIINQQIAQTNIASLAREIKYINENISLEKALKFFQENRIQIALVKGAIKGATQEITGLLTMEDIIEELTGEIRDEFETAPSFTLNQIFDLESSILNIQSTDRMGAIQELVEKLYLNKRIPDKEKVLNKIIDREKAFSTALGHQVAFPHTRLEFLKKPIITIGKSTKGIDFPSPDNQPVKIIFLILTPFNDPTLQLKILSKLSKLISNITLRKRLFNATTLEQISNIFSTFENKIPEAK